MAAKQPLRQVAARLVADRLTCPRPCARRAFSSASARFAASNFSMPAMSPTMTEGNITSWKVKEGDAFSAGDILLEIETDKASMDVEAQDDGLVAKIFSPDGSKSVKVGTRIAVLAEPGDDLASLDIPADDSASVKAAPAKVDVDGTAEVKKSPAKSAAKKESAVKTAPQGSVRGQNPKYPLYPSVIALVHENHIASEDVAKIPATGPNGRLLKGDVLAYLGQIASDSPAKVSQEIEHRGHLDLSNIKLLAEQPKAKPQAAEPKAEVPLPALTSVALPISLSEVLKVQKRLQDTLGVSLSLSTFLSRAVDVANDDLPKPKGAKATADELFNAVLGLDSVPTTSRGTYLPQIGAFASNTVPRRQQQQQQQQRPKADIIDILSGNASPVHSSSRNRPVADLVSPSGGRISTTGGAVNVFSLRVPVNEEHRAKVFLQRIQTVLQVEPGRLVL